LQVQRSQVITEEIEESQSGMFCLHFDFDGLFLKRFISLEIDAQSIETSSYIQESVALSKEVCKNYLM